MKSAPNEISKQSNTVSRFVSGDKCWVKDAGGGLFDAC